jgi:phosphoketolase
LLRGYGWLPHFVEGHEPELMHEALAATLGTAVEQIRQLQHEARASQMKPGCASGRIQCPDGDYEHESNMGPVQ